MNKINKKTLKIVLQGIEDAKNGKLIRIYNKNMELIYETPENSPKAKKVLKKAFKDYKKKHGKR
jgi:hypothetical protein